MYYLDTPEKSLQNEPSYSAVGHGLQKQQQFMCWGRADLTALAQILGTPWFVEGTE